MKKFATDNGYNLEILCENIKEFFPSITNSMVYSIFYNLGYSKEMSNIFTTICTYKKVIPKGAPTSPKIANLCCKKLDKRIGSLCKKYGVSNHLAHINCNKAFYKEHLYGKAYFINMVEPLKAEKIIKQLDKIKWTY